MTLTGVFNLLDQIKARAEDAPPEGVIALEVIDVLLDFIGNQKLREKVDEIPL